ncbi:hypothetical protein AB7M25_004722 [Pseudomonas sp. AP3_22 TE3818]
MERAFFIAIIVATPQIIVGASLLAIAALQSI